MIVCVGTVRGGHCSVGHSMAEDFSAWQSHVESKDEGFRAIDFIWGLERPPVWIGKNRDRGPGFDSPTPAKTGDKIRAAFGYSEFPLNSWFRKAPVRRISSYRATITNGSWPTTYPKYFGTPNYWYVKMVAHLPHGDIETSPQIGTTNMPFSVGDEIWVTVDLLKENPHPPRGGDNYNYST